VKLLLDHNISRKLCANLADLYPESSHTRFLNYQRAADPEIWFHGRTHGFILERVLRSNFAKIAALADDSERVVLELFD
jgi:predicted nuclease of predicted toxin-antitoxin system